MCDEQREPTVEEQCQEGRVKIEELKGYICSIFASREFENEDLGLKGFNIPSSKKANIRANITLAFRHLEDARMRLGKAMQACQGGISILDKYKKNPDGTVK